MSNDFDVVFFSDSSYEEITVEISYKNQILCQLNKDLGPDSIEIEFFSDARILSKQPQMKFDLGEFLKVIAEVSDELKRS